MSGIVQLIPAEGWRAVVVSDPGASLKSREVLFLPLCAWALVEDDEGDRQIVGMVANEPSDYHPQPVTELPKYQTGGWPIAFYGYSPPGEEFDERMAEGAFTQIDALTEYYKRKGAENG
jgi:hypothetical protein